MYNYSVNCGQRLLQVRSLALAGHLLSSGPERLSVLRPFALGYIGDMQHSIATMSATHHAGRFVLVGLRDRDSAQRRDPRVVPGPGELGSYVYNYDII